MPPHQLGQVDAELVDAMCDRIDELNRKTQA